MASKKTRPRRPAASTSRFPDEGTTGADLEITSLAIPTGGGTPAAPIPGETVVAEALDYEEEEAEEKTVSGETTGRTWPDIVYPYSSNARYVYVIELLVIGLGFGGTGHLQTGMEQAAASGLAAVVLGATWLVQRR